MRRTTLLLAILIAAVSFAAKDDDKKWTPLFDGKTMGKWKVADFGGHGEPSVEDGELILPVGEGLTGIVWGEKPPAEIDYEIELQAKRVNGGDFFCGLTFPYKDSAATLVVGGWGGSVIGISSLDDQDASENDTTTAQKFETDKWYRIRVRVMDGRILAWIDDKDVVDVSTKDKKVSTRIDIDECRPLGVASWRTTAALKDIKMRKLTAEELKEAKGE